MKKRSTINLLKVVFILGLVLLIVSCGGNVPAGERPTDTIAALKQVQSGTQGVEVGLLSNYPPPLIYDQNELVALVEVKNKGNHNLEAQDCFIQITGFDPNIIRGSIQNVRSCADNLGTLEGKSVYNLDGGFNQLEFSSTNVELPTNVFEYNPKLNFVTCYNYQTVASPSVCVDPVFYQITSEQKSCRPMDVSMGGGQGAPVSVSSVGVDMVGSRAIFEINIRNSANGRVLSPNADIRNCAQTSLSYTDLDRVDYTVELSGGSLVDCKPQDGIVRLNNNNGKIVCTFEVSGGSAFETPLQITLDYAYLQSFQKQIKVIKTPG
ncbi:hypothetical protein J4437_02160 [Candidatus Woesearchaeota archaeon]|nr:hypothetical protein [Candidatus Woesearchaeota archaeon]